MPRNPKNDCGIVLLRIFFHSPELTTLGAEMVPKGLVSLWSLCTDFGVSWSRLKTYRVD